MADKDPERARARAKAWYYANKARALANVHAYAAKNREHIKEKSKAARDANKDVLSARSRAYYEAHRRERIAYQKALHAAKPEAVRAYKKQWWERNKELFSQVRGTPEARARMTAQRKRWYDKAYARNRLKFLEHSAKRRALKATTAIEPIDLMQILRESNGVCGICKKPLDLFGIDFDHIVPLSRGGAHVRANIQATHAYCNRSKGAKVG